MRAAPLPSSVRVRSEVVDRFLTSVGELMQRHARLEALQARAPDWEDRPAVQAELEGMARLVRELRRRALDIRTTALRRMLERFPRVVQELADLLGKQVQVEIVGEDVEVDRAVIEHLDDPMLHLVRNAVDHGIETPAEREAAGKPRTGRLRLAAARVGSRLHVRIEEDGRGIDTEAVRARAVEQGLLLEMVAEDLPRERVHELVFEPGISTRDEVSELSGRGVGLDVVKRGIEGLGGTVTIESEPGRGTAFEIDVPAMVALQRVLVLQIQGERIALAVTAVEAVLSVKEGEVEAAGGDAFFLYRDEPIPLVDLGRRLGLPPTLFAEDRGNVVVVQTRGLRLGLWVERAVTDLEVFVREVPAILRGVGPLAGVAVLPDGVPVFLLEVGILVERFE